MGDKERKKIDKESRCEGHRREGREGKLGQGYSLPCGKEEQMSVGIGKRRRDPN